MSNDAPLLRLGCSTAEAIAGALEGLAPGDVHQGAVQVSRDAHDAAAGLVLPAVVAEASYLDGVILLMLPVAAARRMAGADGDDELGESELSAVGTATHQVLSAAAEATGGSDIATPRIHVVQNEPDAVEILTAAGPAHIVSTDFAIGQAPSRLVQLVPNASVVRMTRALDELTQEYTSAPLGDSLRSVPVRIWAELGRARMAAGASLGVATGSVLELDREVDDPIDLYVDGMRFATGRLLVADDGTLQLEVEHVVGLHA